DGGRRPRAARARGHQLRHTEAMPALLDGASAGRHADGWAEARGGGAAVTLVAPFFWQEYPKALRVGSDRLAIDLFAGKEAPVQFGNGRRQDARALARPRARGRRGAARRARRRTRRAPAPPRPRPRGRRGRDPRARPAAGAGARLRRDREPPLPGRARAGGTPLPRRRHHPPRPRPSRLAGTEPPPQGAPLRLRGAGEGGPGRPPLARRTVYSSVTTRPAATCIT